MKKILFILFVSCCSVVYSQNINFTDSKFKALIVSSSTTNEIAKDLNGNSIAIDANGDGEIQISEAQQVKKLTIQLPTFNASLVPDGVSDATKFTNVEELYIYHANSVILNYLNNNKIRRVKYEYTNTIQPSIVQYLFDNCSALQNLNDVIISPDISQSYPFPKQILTVKNCLQVSGIQNIEGELKELIIENCPVSDLTIIVDAGFEKLNVPNLSSLVNIKLSSLDYGNFASIPVQVIANDCVNLQQITTQDILPYISFLNVNNCSNLKKIKGLNTPTVDFSAAGLVNLEELDCALYNRYIYTSANNGSVTIGNVTTLNLTGLPNLKKLVAFNQPISTVDFSSTPLLEEIDMVNTIRFMSSFNVSNLSHLHTLKAYKPHAEYDSLPQNLEFINAQNCTALTTLEIGGNFNLKSLNLQNCSSLQTLSIGFNYGGAITYNSFGELNTLNLLQCSGLEELYIYNTKINSLNLADCLALNSFEFSSNPNLTSINIRNNSIEQFYIFSQYNNPNLSVCVDDAQLTDMQNVYPNINFTINCDSVLNTDDLQTSKTTDINIFPNPVKDFVQIKSSNLIKKIQLLDIQGRTIITQNHNQNLIKLDLSTISAGIYLVKITTEKTEILRKIIKK